MTFLGLAAGVLLLVGLGALITGLMMQLGKVPKNWMTELSSFGTIGNNYHVQTAGKVLYSGIDRCVEILLEINTRSVTAGHMRHPEHNNEFNFIRQQIRKNCR